MTTLTFDRYLELQTEFMALAHNLMVSDTPEAKEYVAFMESTALKLRDKDITEILKDYGLWKDFAYEVNVTSGFLDLKGLKPIAAELKEFLVDDVIMRQEYARLVGNTPVGDLQQEFTKALTF